MVQPSLDFDGPTYDAAKDGRRLRTQHERVLSYMRDGAWRTLPQIAAAVGGLETALSARIRGMDKKTGGSFKGESRRVSGGTWVYRVLRMK